MASKVYIIFFHGHIKHILTDRDKAYACLKYLNAGYNYYPAYSIEEFEADVFSVPETDYCELFEFVIEQKTLKFLRTKHKTIFAEARKKNEVCARFDELPFFTDCISFFDVTVYLDVNDKRKAKETALEEIKKYIERVSEEEDREIG